MTSREEVNKPIFLHYKTHGNQGEKISKVFDFDLCSCISIHIYEGKKKKVICDARNHT
jgi:hypothetical protein